MTKEEVISAIKRRRQEFARDFPKMPPWIQQMVIIGDAMWESLKIQSSGEGSRDAATDRRVNP